MSRKSASSVKAKAPNNDTKVHLYDNGSIRTALDDSLVQVRLSKKKKKTMLTICLDR